MIQVDVYSDSKGCTTGVEVKGHAGYDEYYFDIPFEETVRRHNTRDKKQKFGEEDMRRWWREKDFSSVFNEKIITSDIDADSIVEMIYIDSANEG